MDSGYNNVILVYVSQRAKKLEKLQKSTELNLVRRHRGDKIKVL